MVTTGKAITIESFSLAMNQNSPADPQQNPDSNEGRRISAFAQGLPRTAMHYITKKDIDAARIPH